jgi:dihydropteroate synthase
MCIVSITKGKDKQFQSMKSIQCKGKILTFDQPVVMGIVNITPDSFFSGSRKETLRAVIQTVEQMLFEGADLLDFGAFSTRPGAQSVTVEEEIARISPVISEISRLFPHVILSVDTFRHEVAQVAIESGADIINDVSFASDPKLISFCAEHEIPYILMHMRGTPTTMMERTNYKDVVREVLDELCEKIKSLESMGLRQIIVDPGFGFSKTMEQNYELMAGLEQFHQLEKPVLVGISRKSMIYKLLNTKPEEGLNGTIALNTVALLKGAQILRVHDVKEAVEVRKIVELVKQ